MDIIKEPENSLNYWKKGPGICEHCYEAKPYFKYKSKLKEHQNGHLEGESYCKNSSVRKGQKPSEEFEVNHMVKTKSEAEHHLLQLTPNSNYSNASGSKGVRKCKQQHQGCNAMLRYRKSDRFCSTKSGDQIVSGYVIIGSLEHNHDVNVPLYAYCYQSHYHEIIEEFYETLTAAKDEIKKLFATYKEENGMNRRDHTIHYHCDEEAEICIYEVFIFILFYGSHGLK